MTSSSTQCSSTRPQTVQVEDSEANNITDILEECRILGHKLIYLNYKGLTKLPTQLFKDNAFLHVEGIYLKRNLLQTLPQDLKFLSNLKELYVPSNKIADLPEDMSELSKLESLDLSMNNLTHIPCCVFDIKSLKTLVLSQNSIVHLPPDIGKMTGLVTLILNHNKLTSLPSDIQNCSSLQTLNLDKNFLSVVPRQITVLHCLEELSITGNNLLYLPMDLGYCANLKRVYADNNGLFKSVPFSLWSKEVGTYRCGTESNSRRIEFKENNMSAHIPDEIQNIWSRPGLLVTSLLELSFRVVNKYKDILQMSRLPRSLKDLATFATAHCEFHGCNRPLFTAGYPHLMKHPIATYRQSNSITFLGLCCSVKCLDLFTKFPLPL
ncbi:leucine-rich repeat-containing protein 28-like isoform X1 [Antedon mediterranea]|uniref:leucine-rich repeat-containing protein 28-like isoform X1 n=1 Tax=Antedon mediterranea TaxID=105859 RepID=UPI003AF741E3